MKRRKWLFSVAQISSFQFFSLLYFAMVSPPVFLHVDFILSVDFRMTFSLCKEDSFCFLAEGNTWSNNNWDRHARARLYIISLVNWYRVSIYLYFYLPFAAAAVWGEIRGTHVCVSGSVCL